MIFNFFDETKEGIENTIHSFCTHFSLNERFVSAYLSHSDCISADACMLAECLRLDLSIPTTDCNILCKHITTCNDNLASVKKYGLLSLSDALVLDTPLKSFLDSYGIAIIPNVGLMRVSDTVYPIKQNHPFTSELFIALYKHKGELEVLAMRDHSVSNSPDLSVEYPSVMEAPEILWRIGKMLRKMLHSLYPQRSQYFFREEWAKLPGTKRYVLQIEVPLNAFDISDDIDENFKNEWAKLSRAKEDNIKRDDSLLNMARNKKLIELFFGFYYHKQEKPFAQILPDYSIPYSEIVVDSIEEISSK